MMDDKDFYWDWLKHEDNLFTSRNNFFLVAESMFIVAVATLSSSASEVVRASGNLLCLAGFVITIFWLLASLKHVLPTDPRLKENLKKVEKRRKDFDDARKNWWSNNWLIGVYLPIFLLGIWATWLLILGYDRFPV